MIKVFFDGSCFPKNPCGHMGIGTVIYEDDKKIFEYAGFVEQSIENSNNVAEYIAFENALDYILENGLQDETINCCGDSKLVVNQMLGKWAIKEGRYVKYALRCKEKVAQLSKFKIRWISREFNQEADYLSNVEMVKRGYKEEDISEMKKLVKPASSTPSHSVQRVSHSLKMLIKITKHENKNKEFDAFLGSLEYFQELMFK